MPRAGGTKPMKIALAFTIALLCIFVLMLSVLAIVVFSRPLTINGGNLGNMILDYVTVLCFRDPYVHGHHTCSMDTTMSLFWQNIDKSKFPAPAFSISKFRDNRKVLRLFANALGHVYNKKRNATLLFTDLAIFTENSVLLNTFWKAYGGMYRERIGNALDQTLEPATITRYKAFAGVVIHMRCSDIPFVEKLKKRSRYHLQHTDYYTWALQYLGVWDSPDTEICVLGVHRWGGKPHHTSCCDTWTGRLVLWLQRRFKTVTWVRDSRGVLDDFTRLFYARKSIGSSSTFAFTAQIGKRMTDFTMPCLGIEHDGGKFTAPEYIPHWMYPECGLRHKDVKDYTDTERVAFQLGLM